MNGKFVQARTAMKLGAEQANHANNLIAEVRLILTQAENLINTVFGTKSEKLIAVLDLKQLLALEVDRSVTDAILISDKALSLMYYIYGDKHMNYLKKLTNHNNFKL